MDPLVVAQEIDDIRKTICRKQFENELNAYTQNPQDFCCPSGSIDDRIQELKNILDDKVCDNSITNNESSWAQPEMVENYMFKKRWKNLPECHKIIKIREYIEENYESVDDRKKIEENLIAAIHKKKLNSDKSVDYDPANEKIISISLLK